MTKFRTRSLGCTALLLAAGTWWSIDSPGPSAQVQTPEEAPSSLAIGVAVDRAMAANEAHRFQLPIRQGQAIRLSVDQLGVDVSLEIGLEPASALPAPPPIQHDEASKHHFGRELLVWPAPAPGTVQLTVRAKSVMPSGGRYHLLATLFEPSETLTKTIDASDDAARLTAESSPASADRARQRWEQAVQGWTALGDRELLANTLSRLGTLQRVQLMRLDDAIATDTKALGIYQELGLATESTATLLSIAASHFVASEPQQAIETLLRAEAFADAIDPINRAIIEDDIARDYIDVDFEQAVRFGEQAVERFRAAGAYYDESVSLTRLALAYSRMQQGAIALERITRALTLGREYGKQDDVASTTLLLGKIQFANGDEEGALASFRASGDQFTEAARFNKVAARLFEARIYNRRGDLRAARDLLEPMLATLPTQARALWAGIANELSVTLAQDGDPARALELQKKALEIVEQGQSRAGTVSVLRDLAATYRALGDIPQANATIDRATAVVGGVAPGSPYSALLLRERARNARAVGDLVQARQQIEAALTIIDSERGRLQTQGLRTAFGATCASFYAEAIDIEMAMHAQSPAAGHDARAFELFERARARSLSDLLSEARVDINAGVDPALMSERRTLERQLGSKDAMLRDLGDGPVARARATTLETEIDDITRRLDLIDGRIRTASPRYAALTVPPPVSLTETQGLLDDHTVLLAFSVGSGTSWGWAITQRSIRSFPLPDARSIEQRAQRVYADLTARERHEGNLAGVDRQLSVDAAALGDLVLGPIAASLRDEWSTHRLAIIATGSLEYIPFGALPEPIAGAIAGDRARGTRTGTRSHPNADTRASLTRARPLLVAQHEIVRLPSASVLSLLRSESRPDARAAAALAVLADPVYAPDDPRVHAQTLPEPQRTSQATPVRSQSPVAATRGLPQSVTASGDGTAMTTGFTRLMSSRREADAIAKLARGSGVMEALDFSANVHTMASADVAQARIVHVASHGILNSVRPELSGLVLSLVDEQGRPQDGVFHLYDVFNLKLAADLVVLSGCETGLGRQMNGEGLIGLTRGFMYAGVPRVVASLWQVDDVATAELMRRFYAGMLQQHLTPAAALHAAQRQMSTHAPWRSPYYWAAFTLVGDWR